MNLTLTDETMQSELQTLSINDLLALKDAIDKESLRRIAGLVADSERIGDKFERAVIDGSIELSIDKLETGSAKVIDYSGENH